MLNMMHITISSFEISHFSHIYSWYEVCVCVIERFTFKKEKEMKHIIWYQLSILTALALMKWHQH
jgi:glycosylphosphatidylinositol transamidase (GPIT) subunit GPI8